MTLQARRIFSLETASLIVGVMTNPADRNSFVPVDTIEPNESIYEEFTVYFNNYFGSGGFIALMAPKLSSGYNQIYVDNIVVDQIPSCPKPVDLAVSQATETSITLSWREIGTASAWMIEYGPTGFTPGTGTSVTSTSTTFTIDGLTTNTAYDFYVRSDCDGEESQQAVLMARTSCGTVSPIPYYEDFNAYNTITSTDMPPMNYPIEDELPNCWSFVNRSYSRITYPMAFITAYSPNGAPGNCLMLKSSSTTPLYAVLPDFTENLQNLQISFKYKNEGISAANGTLSLGYMTAPNDVNTFVVLQDYPKTMAMTEVVRALSDIPDTVSSAHLAFKFSDGANNNYYLCLDDIKVDYIPDCQMPTGLTVSSVSADTAVVSGTAGDAETAWNLQYKQASASDWNSAVPVMTTTHTLTGLLPNTIYRVRVQAACDADNLSDWTSAVTFITEEIVEPCDAPSNLVATEINNHDVTLTWTENGAATAWDIHFRIHDAATWNTQTVTTNPYTLSDLEGLTSYDIFVTSICDETNSESSDTIMVSTKNVGVDNYLEAKVSIYPNPTTGQFTIYNGQLIMNNVAVYDVYGKLLSTMSANGSTVEVDLGQYAAGVYFLRISTENGVVTKRIVKR